MPKRLLVCDDSELMRKMVGDSLVASGWEIVAEAASGADAVDKYKQFRPDAVTMDIVMPGSDGLAGLSGILAVDPNAKVVMVSAVNQTKLISEAIRKGAQDFIAKPFLPETLQATMNNCVSTGT